MRSKLKLEKLCYAICISAVQCILMDDETYVKMDSRTIPGAQFYTKVKGSSVDLSILSIKMEKFGEQIIT